MGRILRNEQCPECAKNGADTRGDNLVRYQDGGAFCFACRYHEKQTSFMTHEPPTKTPLPRLVPELDKWAPKNLAWLRKYLNDEEIEGWFEYAPDLDRHVFFLDFTKPDGEEEFYWEARAVDKPGEPKVKSHGTKPYFPIYHGADGVGKDHLVIVEDVVSSIKLARHFNTLPLFGCYCPNEWIVAIHRNTFFKKVVIWLDSDKLPVAMELLKKLRYLKPTTVVHTPKDPKDYDNEEFLSLVMDEPLEPQPTMTQIAEKMKSTFSNSWYGG